MSHLNGCVVCGRSLKTGRKYCYIHRSLSRQIKTHQRHQNDPIVKLIIEGIILLVKFFWWLIKNIFLGIYWPSKFIYYEIKNRKSKNKENKLL